MPIEAVIFDVDGTLIDSNHLHIQAWQKALEAHGYQIAPDRIAAEIGKGGDKLIPSILGHEIDRKDGETLRSAHSEQFLAMVQAIQLPHFPGVQELFDDLRRRDIRIALATSSQRRELDATQRSAGLVLTDMADLTVTGDMAAESKPAPAILTTTLEKLELSPPQCVMIGDTPYDVDASRDAGLVCLGMLAGRLNSRQILRQSGSRAEYDDPADLLRHLHEALQIASPISAPLTRPAMEALMEEALLVARQGMSRGEVPIGCVLARGDGTIIARGHNELNAKQDKTAHAEMVAFARAAGKAPVDARDFILVSTLEPCVMCLGASMEAAVDTILFGLHAPADGGRVRVRPPVSPESQMPRIIGGIYPDESRSLLAEFLKRPDANPQQKKFVQQLLRLT